MHYNAGLVFLAGLSLLTLGSCLFKRGAQLFTRWFFICLHEGLCLFKRWFHLLTRGFHLFTRGVIHRDPPPRPQGETPPRLRPTDCNSTVKRNTTIDRYDTIAYHYHTHTT